jgi:hypothetical protein
MHEIYFLDAMEEFTMEEFTMEEFTMEELTIAETMDWEKMTPEEMTEWVDDRRCRVLRSATFKLLTNKNNVMRAMNDLLNAFPYKKAAIYVIKTKKTLLKSLLKELNYNVGGRTDRNNDVIGQILIGCLDKDVDLVIVLPGATGPVTSRPIVVINIKQAKPSPTKINTGAANDEIFPLPNVTKGAASYSDKIVRFLSARTRRVISCHSSSPRSKVP